MSPDPTSQGPDEQPVDDVNAAEADERADKGQVTTKSAAGKPVTARRVPAEVGGVADPPVSKPGEFTVTTAGIVRTVLVLLAVVAVVAIALLSWQFVAKSRTLAAFDDSKAASEHFVKTYFPAMMAQGATEEQIKDEILPLTAGEAKERIELEAQTSIKVAQEAGLANIEIEVGVVTVASFSTDRATTLLTAEMSGTSATAPGGGKQPFLFELDLVKEGGTWLVSRMTTVQGVSADPATGQMPPGQPQNPAPQPTQQAPAEQPAG